MVKSQAPKSAHILILLVTSLRKYKKVKYLGKGSYGAAILVSLRGNEKKKFVIKEIVVGHMKESEQLSAEKTQNLSRRYLTDMLTCPLCLDIFCEPIGTTCGHTFCRICLGDAMKRTKRECPMCRAVCMLDINKVKENSVISSLVQEEFAKELEIKKKDMVKMGSEAPLIPVFIYNRATFPGEKLSFRFFEPRYKLLCKRIVDSGSMEFAYYSGHTEPKPGTLCHVLTVTKMEEDQSEGVFNVEVHCPHEDSRSVMTDYFVETGTRGLAMCRTKVLHDDPVPADRLENLFKLARQCDALLDTVLASDYLPQSHINELVPLGYSRWPSGGQSQSHGQLQGSHP